MKLRIEFLRLEADILLSIFVDPGHWGSKGYFGSGVQVILREGFMLKKRNSIII